jgi:hypothetical protein
MKKLIAGLTLLWSTAYADLSAYHESPYIEGSSRMVERSLLDKVFHDLFPDIKLGDEKGYVHFGVVFEGWDIPNNKLFLTVYANQAPNFEPPNIERRVIYDLKTHKVAFEKWDAIIRIDGERECQSACSVEMDIASIFVPDEIRNATKAALALCPVTYAGLNETAADIIAHWEERTGATFRSHTPIKKRF